MTSSTPMPPRLRALQRQAEEKARLRGILEGIKLGRSHTHALFGPLMTALNLTEVSSDDTIVVNEELAATPIEKIGLQVRPLNVLKREGYHTIGELIVLSDSTLLALRYFNQAFIDDLDAKLYAKFGVQRIPGSDPELLGISQQQLDKLQERNNFNAGFALAKLQMILLMESLVEPTDLTAVPSVGTPVHFYDVRTVHQTAMGGSLPTKLANNGFYHIHELQEADEATLRDISAVGPRTIVRIDSALANLTPSVRRGPFPVIADLGFATALERRLMRAEVVTIARLRQVLARMERYAVEQLWLNNVLFEEPDVDTMRQHLKLYDTKRPRATS